MTKLPELMAPAGEREAGFAALQYGADAVYAGLRQFSARADAANFSVEELDELTAYAHAHGKRVYVPFNTLVQERELRAAVAALGTLDELGVDAVIVQDLGVAHLARREFPRLRLHASTQMAVHSREGVEALGRLGYARVTLAREMTVEEIRECAAVPGVEVEAFAHGALCYAYSGLCLMSSHLGGRSGNRGRCAYPCRLAAEQEGKPCGALFSMKDLAAAEQVPELIATGIASLKLEGRKKSPLYVAAVTSFYRDCLDGKLPTAAARASRAEEIQTIFSRLWTPLYLASAEQAGVVDPHFAGHRGAPIGEVETAPVRGILRFRTRRAIEHHDGLQIDVPGTPHPYGFPVDRLRAGSRSVFEAPAGAVVEVGLPPDHPRLPPGATIYCSSSQAVKQRFPVELPKPGSYRVRQPVAIELEVAADGLTVTATTGPGLKATATLAGPFEAARDPAAWPAALQRAFGSLGDTPFELAELTEHNPGHCFVPVSRLNEVRRRLAAELAGQRQQYLEASRQARQAGVATPLPQAPPAAAASWSVKVDRLDLLDGLAAEEWAGLEEAIVELHDPAMAAPLLAHPCRDRLRIALPIILREPWLTPIRQAVETLAAAGWRRWQIANPAHLTLLPQGLDLTADWPLYTLNHLAADCLAGLGNGRCTLSPEDDGGNYRALAGLPVEVVVYQDTPLFLSRTLAAPPGPVKLGRDRFQVIHRLGTLILFHDQPYCLGARLPELLDAGIRRFRADFLYRPERTAAEVLTTYRRLRAGEPVPGRLANFDRGLA